MSNYIAINYFTLVLCPFGLGEFHPLSCGKSSQGHDNSMQIDPWTTAITPPQSSRHNNLVMARLSPLLQMASQLKWVPKLIRQLLQMWESCQLTGTRAKIWGSLGSAPLCTQSRHIAMVACGWRSILPTCWIGNACHFGGGSCKLMLRSYLMHVGPHHTVIQRCCAMWL